MDVVVQGSEQVDAPTRRALRVLWDRAFGDTFTDDDADHAYGGVHVLVREGQRVFAHASAVPRRIKTGDQPWCTVGYVEAVATDPERQGEGLGRRCMERLREEIGQRWPVAFLSTGRQSFYEALGWERWQGTSYTRTATGVVADGEQEGLMVLRVDPGAVPDLTVSVTCEERPGDDW